MRKTIIFTAIFAITFTTFSQKAARYQLAQPEKTMALQKQNKQQLLNEDEKNGKGRLRCAVLLPVNVVFPNDIQPEKVDDGTLWRMKIDAPEAEALNLYLENFHLPKGAEVYFYNPDFSEALPPLSFEDNPDDGIFVTDHIAGNSIVVELFCPHKTNLKDCFTIESVGYMYRPFPEWRTGNKDFGGSGKCEVNVNCPEGDAWQDQKKSVARILLTIGYNSYWCTGALINNTKEDRTPYFLTAEHCSEGAIINDFKKWKFYFNYEAPTCANPASNPISLAYLTTGAEKIADASIKGGSDFCLLKLNEAVSKAPNLYFSGWNISSTAPTNGVCIHHPDGDIKKISTFTKTPTQSYFETGSGYAYWKVNWAKTETNWGVTEGGSSGSPLFDQSGYLVGTLTGGLATCTATSSPDYFGMMSYHWDKNGTDALKQLKPWIDPINMGYTKLNGIYSEEVAIREITKEVVKTWPNPVENELFIQLNPNAETREAKIVNILGITMIKKETSGAENVLQLNVSSLTPGIYLIIITDKNSVQTQKIVKK